MKQGNFLRQLNLLFRSVSLILNVAAVLWLGLCMLASFYDVSNKPSYISFFSFTNAFAVLANIAFVIFWLFTKKRRFTLLSILALALCFPILKASIGFNLFSSSAKKEDIALKVMTWNVHLFDLGEWTKNAQSKNKIIDFIKEQDPDILCLQEYYYDISSPNEPYLNTLRELGYSYSEFSLEGDYLKRLVNISAGAHEYINVGTAIFSKFPLENMKRYSLNSDYYNVLGVDVVLASDKKLRVFTGHLQSVTLSNKEVAFAEEQADKLSAKVEPKAKGILTKLMMASSKRAEQANVIDSVIDKTTLPILICGDFNDMPGSYVYRKIKGNLSDAFVEKGFGFGRTYPKIVPTLRIDNIFYDEDFLNCESYTAPNKDLSDHNPVVATFSLKKIKP